MLLSSLLLLLCAAVLHATANALMKQSRDKMAFSWWMLGLFCVLWSPVLWCLPKVEGTGWWLVIASGVLEAVYFFTLTRAYSVGDLSIVYPIARGSAPLFLLLWATSILHERPSAAGICGILAIVSGLYLINLPSLSAWSRPLHAFRSDASRWALVTGLLISCYTAVDKRGVQYFPPWLYVYLILLVCWICISIQWVFPHRRKCLIAEVTKSEAHRRRIWLPIAAASLSGTFGYLLVLAAMRISPVSYIGAVREVSVVIGSVIGIKFLGESSGSMRIPASVLIAAGIAMIAVFG